MRIVDKVRQSYLHNLNKQNVELEQIGRDEGVTTYHTFVGGWMPLTIALETHLGRRQTPEEAVAEWERLFVRLMKRYRKMILQEKMTFELSGYECGGKIRNFWLDQIQVTCCYPYRDMPLSWSFFVPEEFARNCEDYDRQTEGGNVVENARPAHETYSLRSQ